MNFITAHFSSSVQSFKLNLLAFIETERKGSINLQFLTAQTYVLFRLHKFRYNCTSCVHLHVKKALTTVLALKSMLTLQFCGLFRRFIWQRWRPRTNCTPIRMARDKDKIPRHRSVSKTRPMDSRRTIRLAWRRRPTTLHRQVQGTPSLRRRSSRSRWPSSPPISRLSSISSLSRRVRRSADDSCHAII